MNLYAILILVFLVLDWLLSLVADVLNLGRLEEELPREFAGVWDRDEYRKSQQYLITNTRFSALSRSVRLAALLVFWFLGGFNALDLFARGFGLNPVFTGLIFVGVLGLLSALLSLPFDLYGTFVIEERFGFNQTTWKTFVLDRAKGLLLLLLLGAPLFAGVLLFFQKAGNLAWIYSFAGVAGFMVILQFLAPVLIMPLFFKFKPLEDEGLKEKILAYAQKVGFSLKNVFEVDASRRSKKSNAFFTGFGKNRRAALFDTLLKNHPPEEIVAVLAHEIGHFKKAHILKGLFLSLAHLFILFFLLSLFLTKRGLFDAFFMDRMSVYAGFVFFGLLYTPAETLLSLAVNAWSRKNERQADAFAAETLDQPQALASALVRLSRDNLSNLTPHPLYVALNYSHPPVLARVQRLRNLARKD